MLQYVLTKKRKCLVSLTYILDPFVSFAILPRWNLSFSREYLISKTLTLNFLMTQKIYWIKISLPALMLWAIRNTANIINKRHFLMITFLEISLRRVTSSCFYTAISQNALRSARAQRIATCPVTFSSTGRSGFQEPLNTFQNYKHHCCKDKLLQLQKLFKS